MTTKGSVFLVGPGFIGLEVITELLREGYQVTALARREEARADLERFGCKTVAGSLDDHDTIRAAAAAADIVFHTATADHLPSALAVLDGVEDAVKAGKTPIYIHTSGTSAIVDEGQGERVSEKIYEDDKPETIDSISDDAPHRFVDLEILKRRTKLGTKAKISIVLPPLIYGRGKAPGNRLSIQIPTMTRFAIKHGWAGHAGKGNALWSQVHVSDLARGYITVLHYMETTPSSEILPNPYFFAENGEEHSWRECAEEIGRALHKAGKVKDPEPTEIPAEMHGDIFGEATLVVGAKNSRSRANRLRKLGWEPREKGGFQSLVEDELPIILAETGVFNGYGGTVA